MASIGRADTWASAGRSVAAIASSSWATPSAEVTSPSNCTTKNRVLAWENDWMPSTPAPAANVSPRGTVTSASTASGSSTK